MQVTMSKEEGVRTVVVGGKQDVQQQYCGMIVSTFIHINIDTSSDLNFRHRHSGRAIFGFLNHGHRSQSESMLPYR